MIEAEKFKAHESVLATSKIYDAMIDKAAAEMRSALMQSPTPGEITLWAVHTTPEHDGFLAVGVEPPVASNGKPPININPSNNRASGYFKWCAVPYSALRSIIYQACHREPILPLERLAVYTPGGHEAPTSV